jgi:signal transduction histidine kinase/CheY-like chemotaxis protein
VHFLLVQFGELFIIPIGFSSPIWPASGVILGLYLCFGTPILFGALLSSLICFSQYSFTSELPSYAFGLLSIISVLQLLISKKLVESFCILPVKVYIPLQIIKFLVLTGPVTAFITSILSMCVLNYFLLIESDILLYMGGVKWVGDFMSIVFITPIILFTVTNGYVKKARHTTVAVITSLLSLIAVSMIFIVLNQSFMKGRMQDFISSTKSFTTYVTEIETVFKQNLQALDGLFQTSNLVSRDEFKAFIEKIKSDKIKVRAISWLPLVEQDERGSFESSLMSLNLNSKHIRALTDNGVVKAPEQGHYLPIYFIEPFEENKSAIGLDVSSHPIVKSSINKAIDKRTHVITPLLSLVQQLDKYTGVIVYYPVYKKQGSEIDEKLIGLVEVVFELDKLLTGFYQQANINSFNFIFSYGAGNTYEQPSYNSKGLFSHSIIVNLFDKQGTITFSSTPRFELLITDWFSLVIMILGCVLGVICVMFLFFIVTFNFSLSRKVKESTSKLTKSNEELVVANRAKNLFLANISHEYRTPLNAIIGFTEIAQRETNDETAIDYLSKIRHSSDILLNIVNDVLDISKIQAGELNLENRVFMPSKVTLEVIEMLQGKAKEQLIALEYDFTADFSLWVEGDETRFKQIIINLLNNAIKFTPKGKVKVVGSYSCERGADACLLTLSVEDSGIGISHENQQCIFTPFTQAEISTTREYGGTGIGLSIVKQLCLMMGGDIKLRSRLGEGSIFTVTVALTKAKEPQVSHEKEASNDVLNTSYKVTKVLVVEDNKINQLIVQKQLSPLGVNCDFANDGEQAIKYLEKSVPDLILMDLQMPVMDGFTASSIIKKTPQWKQIPIVILSASVGKQDKEKALKLGIEYFINKPFQQEDLIRILDKYFPKQDRNYTDDVSKLILTE